MSKPTSPQPALNPKALSRDGYIISQAHTADIPYGAMRSDYNGCGWIAAYNLLRAMGRRPNAVQVSAALAAGSPYNGWLGTGPRRLRYWLAAQGLKTLGGRGKKTALQLMTSGRPGIICYLHPRGAHFVTFLPQRGGQVRLLNAVDGAASHISTPEAFLSGRPLYPLYTMAAL